MLCQLLVILVKIESDIRIERLIIYKIGMSMQCVIIDN